MTIITMLAALLALLVASTHAASIDQQVVNGVLANQHEYPPQLSLQSCSGTSCSHICGAVLVSPSFAITAAHCVGNTPSSYRLKCGAHNIHTTESYRQARTPSAIVVHPQYNPNGQRPAFPNDIAVIRLSQPFNIDSTCTPAVLPTATSGDFGNRAGVITGWGRLYGGGTLPSRLKEGPVTIMSTTNCANTWGTTVSSTIHICVTDSNGVYGACNGDSGGPAHVTSSDGTIVGLASFVANGCLVQYPSVYVRISNYRNWIDSTIASLG